VGGSVCRVARAESEGKGLAKAAKAASQTEANSSGGGERARDNRRRRRRGRIGAEAEFETCPKDLVFGHFDIQAGFLSFLCKIARINLIFNTVDTRVNRKLSVYSNLRNIELRKCNLQNSKCCPKHVAYTVWHKET